MAVMEEKRDRIPAVDPWSVVLGGLVTFGLAAAGFILGVGAAGRAGETQSFWYLSRSAGLVAYALLWGSVAWGLLLSARPGGRLRPAGLFDAHQFLSNAALGFAFFHALVLIGDRYASFPLSAILAPFAGTYKPALVALGQIALWLSLFLSLSFLVRKQIGQRRWRAFHYVSYAVFWIALLHSVAMGSDTVLPWVRWMYVGTAGSVVLLTVYRILRAGRDARVVQPQY
jgi:predicted ferric reductase